MVLVLVLVMVAAALAVFVGSGVRFLVPEFHMFLLKREGTVAKSS